MLLWKQNAYDHCTEAIGLQHGLQWKQVSEVWRWKQTESLHMYIQGVLQNWAHFVFCYFVGFYSCKVQKFQEMFYIIGRKIN